MPSTLPWNVATTIGMTLGVMSKGTSYEDESDLLEAGAYAGGLVYVWNRTRVLGALGPYGLAYMGGAALGTAISGAIWGAQGVLDAAEFYTGQGNYLTADPHGSGYFNVVSNIQTIAVEESKPGGAFSSLTEDGQFRHRPGPLKHMARHLWHQIF